MSANFLTSDNYPLSRPTLTDAALPNLHLSAQAEAPADVQALVNASLSENTKRAYACDLSHFQGWGGQIPANELLIASYLAAYADTLSSATLARRLVSISKAHQAKGFIDPICNALVRATLQGIKRRYRKVQRQAKPLLRDDLFAVLDVMGDTVKDVRDRALLLIGFAGGFRRSELVALDLSNIEFVRRGAIISISRSKTDQVGAGRKIGIPLGRTRHCPIAALDAWIAKARLTQGPVFCPVNRHGLVQSRRLSGAALSLIIKERTASAGFIPVEYSGHSLRAGLATSAAQAGVALTKIRQQTGHASDTMLTRYIRDGQLFADNAAGVLL